MKLTKRRLERLFYKETLKTSSTRDCDVIELHSNNVHRAKVAVAVEVTPGNPEVLGSIPVGCFSYFCQNGLVITSSFVPVS